MILDTVIKSYFPDISSQQEDLFSQLFPLYHYWNERINLISRKDIDELYERHVLHSLGIAKCVSFAPASGILDVGTGGGFPGIPLAILFPQSHFTLIDAIGKKITVVNEIVAALKLQNVTALKVRAEELPGNFDFVVSRAVTDLPTFLTWIWKKITPEQRSNIRNGVLYLKGGDLTEELSSVKQKVQLFDLSLWFKEEFFSTKKIVYIAK